MSDLPVPWEGETPPVPAYVQGCPVVAALKVPTLGTGESPHQWVVVTQDNGRFGTKGMFMTWDVELDKALVSRVSARADDYFSAVYQMLHQAGLREMTHG